MYGHVDRPCSNVLYSRNDIIKVMLVGLPEEEYGRIFESGPYNILQRITRIKLLVASPETSWRECHRFNL